MNTHVQLSKHAMAGDLPQDAVTRARGILNNWRLIAGVAALVTLLGALYALSAPPVYQANMLIQIKREPAREGGIVGGSEAATEVELLRSRQVLSRVVDSLRLDVTVVPKRFPVVGAYLARGKRSLSAPGLAGHGGYAWGAEEADVARFAVPAALLGEPFVLTATGRNGYTLAAKESGLVLAGRIGAPARLATPYGEIEALVTGIRARPGTQFIVNRAPVYEVVNYLQQALIIAENGKQSNVIGVSLKGGDPVLISRILNQVAAEYLQQHARQRSTEADDTLARYDRQLEESRARLRQLDARFAQLLGRHGTANLAEESRVLAQHAVALEERLAEAESKRAELSSRYLSMHPAMIVADDNVRSLRQDLAAVLAKRRSLAAAEQEAAGVERDKQVTAELNAGLMAVRQKLDGVAASDRKEVRLVDRAEVPLRPITLGTRTMIVLSCLAGLVIGLLASMVKNAFADHGVRPSTLRYNGQFRLV
ncbi:MAG: Wzz/FepE/Etk N-terminal domain-containing protein [Janthinobacterium lividum]